MITKKNDIRFWSSLFIVLASVFVINFLPTRFLFLHCGKDNGQLFIIFASCFIGSWFFYRITKRILFGIIGFIITISSFLFLYFLVSIMPENIYKVVIIVYKYLLFDQIFSFITITLIGLVIKNKFQTPPS